MNEQANPISGVPVAPLSMRRLIGLGMGARFMVDTATQVGLDSGYV